MLLMALLFSVRLMLLLRSFEMLDINAIKGRIENKIAENQSSFFSETLREHEDGTGFTLTTKDARSAFSMAEKMVFSGKKYSIKLGKQPGSDWVLVVDEVAE